MTRRTKDEMTAAQLRVLAALVNTRTITAAAKASRVSRATVYRMLENPTFAAEVGQARRHFFEEALDLVNAGMEKAVSRLLEMLDDKDRAIRIRAAAEVCRLGFEMRQGIDVDRRIAELEDRAKLMLDAGRPRMVDLRKSVSEYEDQDD